MSNQHEITKYPNRRFYDVTISKHVTLSELHQLVVAGHEIVVTDKNTGRDITNVVLTQIILEHDPPKMELFPSSLLHQAIQMNENVVRRFIDQYFAQAMNAFSQSRQQFDSFLNRAGIPANLPTAPMDWFRMFMPGGVASQSASPQPQTSVSDSDGEDPDEPTERDFAARGDSAARDDDIAILRQQVAAMSEQLARLQPSPASDSKPSRKKAKKKTARTKKKRRSGS